MAVTTDPRFGTNRWSAGADPWPARPGWNTLLDLITTVAAIYRQGTFAARPAFSAAKLGTFYYATDQDRLYVQTTTKWSEVSPVGGGGPGLIDRGGSGSEGTSRNGARADHRHEAITHGTRAILGGSGVDPLGSFVAADPVRIWTGYSIQTTNPSGLFDILPSANFGCIVSVQLTPYHVDAETMAWLPVFRGDLSNLSVVRCMARKPDGTAMPNARIGVSFAVSYQE